MHLTPITSAFDDRVEETQENIKRD